MASLVVVLPADPVTPTSGLTPKASNGGRQRLQSDQRVVDRKQTGFDRVASQLILAHYGGDRASFQGLLHEVVAVETLALDCEKEFTRLNGSRVDGVPGRNLLQFAFASCVEELFDSSQGQLHAFRPAPAVAVRHS